MDLLFALLGGRQRWRLLEAIQPPFASDSDIIVIGGCGSSGTTLLRRMLDRHPVIFCGPESTVFLNRLMSLDELAQRFGIDAGRLQDWQCGVRSQAEFVDRFRAACLASAGKAVWADKTPENVRRFGFVRRHFPQARFVHVIRDGRDVACSLRRQSWMKLRERAGPLAIAQCAAYWAERVSAGRQMRGHPRYIEVRYEDLVRQPEPTLRHLLGFLGVEWSDRILQTDIAACEPASGPIFASSLGRWQRELTSREVAALETVSGSLLCELGYAAEPNRMGAQPTGAGRRRPMGSRLPSKYWSRWERLKIETLTLWRLATDRRVPWYVRFIVPIIGAAYYVSPLDLIPDRIPVLGHLDDALVAVLALALFAWLAPAPLLRQHRSSVTAHLASAVERTARRRRHGACEPPPERPA